MIRGLGHYINYIHIAYIIKLYEKKNMVFYFIEIIWAKLLKNTNISFCLYSRIFF